MTILVRVGIATAAATALTFAAQAADMRPVYKAAPVASVYNWTGCYLGGQIGAQRGQWTGDVNYPAGDLLGHPAVVASHDFTNDGNFVYGGQIGCNWQLTGSSFVLGVEGDVLAGSGSVGGEIYRFPAPFTTDHFNTSGKFGTQASLRLKAGFAVDRMLLYVAGGLTWANLSSTASFLRDGDGSLASSSNTSVTGWNIGVGAEYAIVENWRIGLEYRYTDFGSFNTSIPAGVSGGTLTWSAFTASADSLRTQDIRLRVNYAFGNNGVMARY
jgi:outer membrane immunogenic protein